MSAVTAARRHLGARARPIISSHVLAIHVEAEFHLLKIAGRFHRQVTVTALGFDTQWFRWNSAMAPNSLGAVKANFGRASLMDGGSSTPMCR